jgi:oxygen-independent coproporphyrinogen-3 oxidase
VVENPEITLEANPDDLSNERILNFRKVNRLSIGIQSFFEDDLQMMNRAHNSAEVRSRQQNTLIIFRLI